MAANMVKAQNSAPEPKSATDLLNERTRRGACYYQTRRRRNLEIADALKAECEEDSVLWKRADRISHCYEFLYGSTRGRLLPNLVCRQPRFCCFCADSYRRGLRRFAGELFDEGHWQRYTQYVVHLDTDSRACTPEQLPDAIRQLKAFRTRASRAIADRLSRERKRSSTELPLLDCTLSGIHIERSQAQADQLYPHMHLVVRTVLDYSKTKRGLDAERKLLQRNATKCGLHIKMLPTDGTNTFTNEDPDNKLQLENWVTYLAQIHKLHQPLRTTKRNKDPRQVADTWTIAQTAKCLAEHFHGTKTTSWGTRDAGVRYPGKWNDDITPHVAVRTLDASYVEEFRLHNEAWQRDTPS